MDSPSEILNFFGNPGLDRHRLLQGKWQAYRVDADDPDGWSDNPLELLLLLLSEGLSGMTTGNQPAVQALHALLGTALESLSNPEFCNMTRSFWRGFQFVAQCAALEVGVAFKDINRDDVRKIIENRYGPHTT
jgi:hypothetical protein